MAAALAGACAAFLVFNFHPARVFMGDSGSMLLGLRAGGRRDQRCHEDHRRRGRRRAARDPGDPHPRHLVRGAEAPQARAAGLRRRPEPLPPPLLHHRVGAAEDGARALRLVRLMGAVAVALRFVSYKNADGTIDPAGAIGLSVGAAWPSRPRSTWSTSSRSSSGAARRSSAGAPAHRLRPPLPGAVCPSGRPPMRVSAEGRDDLSTGSPGARRLQRAGRRATSRRARRRSG